MTDSKQAVATAARKDVRDLLQSPANLAEMAKVLPKHLTPERMVRVALTAFLKTPKLLECTRESLTQALMVCSQAGLEPDGRLAHLIPYGNVCQVIFDWKGLVALGLRNGFQSIYPDVVYEKDEFEAGVENGIKVLRHRPNWRGERGEPILFYCVTMKGGVLDYEVMSVAEVEAIKQRSRASKAGPWVTDPIEMGKKCPIRRMSKRWDLLPDIRDIIYAEDDTPTDIQQPPKMARPLFSLPSPAPEASTAENGTNGGKAPASETPPPSSAGAGGKAALGAKGNDIHTPPESPGAKNAKTPREGVRACLALSQITPRELLAWCEATGKTDGSQTSIDEIAMEVVKAIQDKWPEVAEQIKSARAGGEREEELPI